MTKDIRLEISLEIPPSAATTYGKRAKFTAFGCVVVEQTEEAGITYRAVNMKTHKSIPLGTGAIPLSTKNMERMAKKIGMSAIAGYGVIQADRPMGDFLHPTELAAIQTRIFYEILPQYGYTFRAGQMELADHMLGALSRRNISLAEAGVGIGKTAAYLVAAALVKRGRANDFWLPGVYPDRQYAAIPRLPVVVATSSIALQNAIMQDYIPDISRILMEHGVINTPLTAVLRKGKQHYICDQRLRTYMDDADTFTKKLLEPLLKGSVDLGKADAITPYIKRKICVSGSCSRKCLRWSTCRYQRYILHCQTGDHDFQICNHNYLLADVRRRAEGQSPLIPDHQAIIIDESHKLLDAARQMYGAELEFGELRRVATDIRTLSFRAGESTKVANNLADRLAEQDLKLFALLIPEATGGGEDHLSVSVPDDAISRFHTIWRLAKSLTDVLKDKPVHKRHTGQLASTLWSLGQIMDKADALSRQGEMVYWAEEQQNGTQKICAIPDNLGELLETDLWRRGVPIVLTSGTMSAGGNFSHIKRQLGLTQTPNGRLSEISRPSPFNYRDNALMYISERTPYPNSGDKQYLHAVADEIERLVLASHGHAAVLFTSYRAMEIVREELTSRRLPYPVFQMNRGGDAVLKRYRESENGVLLASGALWEGIDLPGDILSLLVIVKLPFAVPDPISANELEKYISPEAYMQEVIVPNMLVRLMQGFGRLIRRERDTGAVAILDNRARLAGPYRDQVLAALPHCGLTSDLDVVEGFFRDKKSPEYFR